MLERARTWTEVGRWHGIDATLTLDFPPSRRRLPGDRDLPGDAAAGSPRFPAFVVDQVAVLGAARPAPGGADPRAARA